MQAFTLDGGLAAILGQNNAGTGFARGLVGISASSGGIGTIGFATASSGSATGVQAITNSSAGLALEAANQATS